MGNAQFDTDDPEHEEAASQLGVVLKPMIGMPMTMEVDNNGKVLSFTGMDEINKKVSSNAIASMHWEQMKEEFTNERGKETWGQEPLLIYPNKEVGVGDTWEATSTIERPPMGTFVTTYHFKVDSIGTENGRKVVAISMTAEVTAGEEPEKAGDETGTPEPPTEVSGKLSGMSTYDVELGRVVKQTAKGNVDIKIPLSKLMPAAPPSAEPQFAVFKIALDETSRVLTEKERNAQKDEARKKAEARRLAEEAEDEEDEEDDE
jgi:hypothetical protein